MATLKNLKPGQVLYSVERSYWGVMTSVSAYPIKVLEVHENHVIAFYNNNNTPSRYNAAQVKRWRVRKP